MERLMQLLSKITRRTIAYISVFVAIISVVLVFEAESAIGLFIYAIWTLITIFIGLVKNAYN